MRCMKRSRVTLAITEAAAIAALVASPPTTARCSNPVGGTGKPSLRHSAPGRATRASTSESAARFVLCNPRSSMPRTQREVTATLQAARSTFGYSASRISGVCCLESLSADRDRRSLSVSASMSKSTAAATSGPARQPRPASSAPATKRVPNPRSYRKSRLPVERLRRRARRIALEEPDPLGRPVGGEGFADDPLSGNGTPEPAVVGAATVVAHHEVVVGRNADLAREIAGLTTAAGLDELLLLALAVEDHVPAADGEPVPRSGHHALDEVDVRPLLRRLRADLARRRRAAAALVGLLRPRGRVEDDDVTDRGVAEARADAVDEHPLADLQRGDHRFGRDPVGLHQEGLDAERQPEGDDDDEDELEKRAAG